MGIEVQASPLVPSAAALQAVLDPVYDPLGLSTYDLPAVAKGQTFPRYSKAADACSVLATGVLTLVALPLRAGASLTTITFLTSTTGAGVPVNQWFALYSQALAKLAVTADDGATAWGTNTYKTLTIAGGPFVVPTSGLYYLGIMVKATTVPTLAGNAGVNAGISGLLPATVGGSTGGLTNPASAPANAAAISAVANLPYGFAS